MEDYDEVTYAFLMKRFLRFYTEIRYALPRLFHMWKPVLLPAPQPGFTQRFHAANRRLSPRPWLIRDHTEAGFFAPAGFSRWCRGSSATPVMRV